MDRIELEDLPGVYLLSGVQFGTTRVTADYDDEVAQQILFILDGETYAATEDPNDGYRSSLGYISRVNHDVINRFPPVRVAAVLRSEAPDDNYAHDIVDFVDLCTLKVVMSIGTDNTDDYYPWFVAAFHPENLSVNTHIQEQESEQTQAEPQSDSGSSSDSDADVSAFLDELSECGVRPRRGNRENRKSHRRRNKPLPSVH